MCIRDSPRSRAQCGVEHPISSRPLSTPPRRCFGQFALCILLYLLITFYYIHHEFAYFTSNCFCVLDIATMLYCCRRQQYFALLFDLFLDKSCNLQMFQLGQAYMWQSVSDYHFCFNGTVSFLQRVAMQTRFISYRKSIHPSHAGTVSKRLELGSCGLHCRIAPWL